MGAAWRDTVGRKTNFNQILEYVKEIRYEKHLNNVIARYLARTD